MNLILAATGAVLFLILAPLVGGLIAGVDRVLTARMQSRSGPPVCSRSMISANSGTKNLHS